MTNRIAWGKNIAGILRQKMPKRRSDTSSEIIKPSRVQLVASFAMFLRTVDSAPIQGQPDSAKLRHSRHRQSFGSTERMNSEFTLCWSHSEVLTGYLHLCRLVFGTECGIILIARSALENRNVHPRAFLFGFHQRLKPSAAVRPRNRLHDLRKRTWKGISE